MIHFNIKNMVFDVKKPMPTPMVSSLRLHKNDSEIFDDPKKY